MDTNDHATKTQRRFLNDLLVQHGQTPLLYSQPLTRMDASDQIGALHKSLGEALPAQRSTLRAVHYAHCYATPPDSPDRMSFVDMAKMTVQERKSDTQTREMTFQYLDQVIEAMETGDRQREFASEEQMAILQGAAREHPELAERHGFAAAVENGDAVLKPQAMKSIAKLEGDGVTVKSIGIANREFEKQQAAVRSEQAEQRRQSEAAQTR